jgi:hypothetical protein
MFPSASSTLFVVSCALFFASAAAVPILSNHTLIAGKTCPLFAAELPQYCTCTDGADAAATLTCSINPLSLDLMSFTAIVNPCKSGGASLDLSVHDTRFNVSYAFPEFSDETKGSVPVPGMCSIEQPCNCVLALTHSTLSQAFLSTYQGSPALVFTPTMPSAAKHPPSPLTLPLTSVSLIRFIPSARARCCRVCLSRSSRAHSISTAFAFEQTSRANRTRSPQAIYVFHYLFSIL